VLGINNDLRGPCHSALVKVCIRNIECIALADAGASISLMSSDTSTKLGLTVMKRSLMARGVTKQTLDIIGSVDIAVSLTGTQIHHMFYVANGISHEVLLGTDFLAKLGEVRYDFRRCTLGFGNKEIPMGPNALRGTVRTVNAIEIPALTEMAIVAHVTGSHLQGKPCVFENTTTLPQKVLIGKSIDEVNQEQIWVPMMNPTPNVIKIPAGTIVGNAEIIEDDLHLLSVPSPTTKASQSKRNPGEMLKQSDTDLDADQFCQLRALVDEFSDIIGEGITELGRTSIVQHVVETFPGVQPIKSRPYAIPVGIRTEVKGQIDQMVEAGLIAPSAGNWTSPVVLVKKKDGKWRFCVDYRRLNSVSVKQSMATSSVENAVEIMHGKKFFSSIDLCSGFFQVALHETSREKSGFITPFGCYEFKVMPQGMSGSPATFTRLALAIMADLISEGSSCVYLDDWLMASATFESHLQLLHTVFSRLRYSGLKFRLSKSQLCQKEILYLGHILSSEGIAVAPHNTDKIRKFPTPRNKTEVKRLLGLFGYYRSFIKNFARIAAPIIKLTSKDAEFAWSEECQRASEELRTRITTAPILVFPDITSPFILTTDASATAIGAVLSQIRDNREHPISFYSRTLTVAEKKWDACQQELFAIVCAVKHYRQYLMNVKFKLITDNAACTYILKKPDLSPRLARWAIQLADYDYEVVHQAGKQNVVADALSRAEVSAIESCPIDEKTRNEQKRDYFLGPVLMYLEKGKFPMDASKAKINRIIADSKLFKVMNGLVYRNQQDKSLLAIPSSQRQLLMYAIHDSITAMHPGVTKTMLRLRQHYWFPKMYQTVEKYISECHSCQQRKNPKTQIRVPLATRIATEPFHTLSMDFLGPFVQSADGMKYVLVFTDHFTKWCEMICTADQSASTVARAYVEQVFCKFGAASILLSDRAKSFMSTVMTEVNKLLRTDSKFSVPYSPASNGQVEIYNKTIANMLSHFIDPTTHRDWDRYIPFCQLAHNSSVHTITNASPSMLLFCREMRMPYDLTKPCPTPVADDAPYVAKLHNRMREVWDKARSLISKGKERQKRQYDKKANPSDLQVGDIVLYYNKRAYRNKTSKLLKRWQGMYIIKHLTDTTTAIQLYNEPDQPAFRVHLNLLERYRGPLVRGPTSDVTLDLDPPEDDLSDLDSPEDDLSDLDSPECDLSNTDSEDPVTGRRSSGQDIDGSEPETESYDFSRPMTFYNRKTTADKRNNSEQHAPMTEEGYSTYSSDKSMPLRTRNDRRYGLRQKPKPKRETGFKYNH